MSKFVNKINKKYFTDVPDKTEFEKIKESIALVDREIAGTAEPDADSYYRRGRLYWRLGDKGAAISDYERAVAIDPESPAAEALKLCRDIMDFYNTDLYNP